MIKRVWNVTLTVSDLKRAVTFYEKILKLSKKYEFRDYAGFDCGGVEIGVKTWGGLRKPRKGEPVMDFLVDDVDRFYKVLLAKRVRFVKKPHNTIWGSRVAVFLDPDGNTLQVVQINWNKYFAVCTPK